MDVSPTPAEELLFIQREQFLDARAKGTPAMLAAYEIGWTPRQLKREMSDPAFAELVDCATERRDDAVEAKLYEKAAEGNMIAIQIVLFNRRARDFKDVKRIEINHSGGVQMDVVHSVRDGLLEALRGGMPIGELQSGGVLDVESDEVA